MQQYTCLIIRSNESGKRVTIPSAASLPSCDKQSETNDTDEPPLLIPFSDISIRLKPFLKTHLSTVDKTKYLPIFFPSQKHLSYERNVLMFLPPI